MLTRLRVIFIGLAGLFLLAGCGSGGLPSVSTPPYEAIPGVPAAVNNLGYRIAQEQLSVVPPGGDENSPGFSAADQVSFDGSNRLQGIVTAVTSSTTFTTGVASLKTLPASVQTQVETAYATPLYPTWTMNGHIGSDGTTDSGYAVENEISTALANAVKAAIQ